MKAVNTPIPGPVITNYTSTRTIQKIKSSRVLLTIIKNRSTPALLYRVTGGLMRRDALVGKIVVFLLNRYTIGNLKNIENFKFFCTTLLNRLPGAT